MTSNALTRQVLEQLEAAAPGRVHTGGDIRPDYARDEMPIYGQHMPDAVVEVKTTEEAAAVCKICYENDVPVIPRGAGTGLCGGCVPYFGGVVVDTGKMNAILGYDLENFTVRVQAGILLADLAEDCRAHGMLYPPDPGEKFATVGGNVATNAGGMRAVKYGTTRDYVRAVTVVLPTGEVIRLGGEVSKSSSGYSLLHLMIGSEGTLGLITELSLKLVPQPEQTVSLLGLFPDLDAAISCVPRIKMAGLDPQALEFMNRTGVVETETFLDKKVFPRESGGEEVGAYLLSTFECGRGEGMDAIMERAAETFFEEGALDVIVYDTPEAMRSAWLVRSSCLEAILENFRLTDECDVVVPVPNIAAFVKYAISLEEETGLAVRASGHAGDGNVHINVCAGEMEKEAFLGRAERFMELAYEKARELDGMVSGEHGIGAAKMAYMERFLGETAVKLMQGVKQAFDPKGLFNPGKVCCKVPV